MENTTNLKKNKTLFEKLTRFSFVLYMITLYIFVEKAETVGISRLVFIIYAGFSLLSLTQRKRLHLGKNMFLAYTTITWMYATTLWAYNRYWATDRMNTMWQVFLLFFLTYNFFSEEEDAHEFLLKSLYVSGISLLGYSIYTYGFTEVIDMMSQAGGVRLGREISQENTFGMYNAITVMVAFYYILNKNRYKLFHLGIVATAFLFAMSSGSRKALLTMCIGVLFLVYKKYGLRKLYKVVMIAAVLVLIFILLIRLPMFELVRSRLEMTFETLEDSGTGDSSSQVRFNMITSGWKLFKEKLLIGYGANNFAPVSGFGTYSHNNFIEMLVDFGLIGFALYYSIYVTAIKTLGTSKSKAANTILSILITRILMEFAMVTYYDKMHWIILAFALIKISKPICDKEKFLVSDAEETLCIEEIPCIERTDVSKEDNEEDFEYDQEDTEKTEESYNEPEACFDSLV